MLQNDAQQLVETVVQSLAFDQQVRDERKDVGERGRLQQFGLVIQHHALVDLVVADVRLIRRAHLVVQLV